MCINFKDHHWINLNWDSWGLLGPYILDICQRLRGRKIWVCPGGTTQNLQYTLPCIVVASYGLRNRDTQYFLACVMSDADDILGIHQSFS